MTFQNENEYLIHLLYCAIHNTMPENVPENISLQKVFDTGAVHEVANIAYIAVNKIGKQIPDSLLALWREYYYNAIKRDAAQKKARAEILNALHSHGIYTLEVQGTVVKNYYPQSHLRMMSDLDIIIPAEKLFEAQSVMQAIGYDAKIPHNKAEIQAVRGQLHIELHTEYFYDFQAVHEVLNNPFSSATLNDDYTATVTDTVFYLFHLLHTIKHAKEFMGVGIRRIIDLYYLEIALKDKADFSYIDSVLQEYNLYDIKAKLMAVKDRWLCNTEPNDEISAFEKEILQAGNHGTDEIYYKNIFAEEQSQGKKAIKIRYFLRFIFAPKKDIYESYPFCEKHHYPLVFCWIHRWFFTVFNKQKWKNIKKLFTRLKVKIE